MQRLHANHTKTNIQKPYTKPYEEELTSEVTSETSKLSPQLYKRRDSLLESAKNVNNLSLFVVDARHRRAYKAYG